MAAAYDALLGLRRSPVVAHTEAVDAAATEPERRFLERRLREVSRE